MVRSAASFLAVLILPGFLAAQQATPTTHKVVDGDCLWNLAEHFYGNPYQWRRIWEANKDSIGDPNLIYPGQTLTIPGAGTEAKVTGLKVEPKPAGQPVRQPAPAPPSASDMAHEHTIFYKDTSTNAAGRLSSLQDMIPPVARGRVYAAPWLLHDDQEPAHLGTLVDHAGPATPSETLITFDLVRLDMQGTAPGVGDRFLTYHLGRNIPGVGQVVTPTGLVTVTNVDGDKVIAVVTEEYGHVRKGDFVGPLPAYTLKPGQTGQDVANGPEAMVMGLADAAQLAGLGQVVFLDLGSDDGIALGDEFQVRNWSQGGHLLEGTLQVVGVRPQTSSARVVYLKDDVFKQGVVVRLAKKMD